MFGRSKLIKALKAYVAGGGSLTERLHELGKANVTTVAEARMVVATIDHAWAALSGPDPGRAKYDLHAAIALLQSVDSQEAFDVLSAQGLPRLRAIVRDRLANPADENLPALFALKLVAMFHQPQDVALVAETARAGLEADSWFWTPVFYALTPENSCTPALVAALSEPLPGGFIRIAFLDRCNELAIGGHLSTHPFATPQGIAALEQYLSSNVEDEASYASSACSAIPFVPSMERARLLDLARRHPAVEVRLEAAWAGAKLQMPAGVDDLIAFTREPHSSAVAVRYLRELRLGDHIPPDVLEPDFVALAEICQWIAHPNECGRPPDQIVQVDSRELFWPPTRDRRRLWVFRYRYDRDGEPHEGYGLVGSVTWAMFGQNTVDKSPEDIYGLHCSWELIQNGDPQAPKETEVAAGKAILTKYNPDFGRPKLHVVQDSFPPLG